MDLRRKREREERRARATEEAQAVEAERWANLERDIRRHNRRKVAGWVLVGLSLVLFVTHFLSHVETLKLPLSKGWQDLLIGYPTAGLLLVVATILLGQVHPAERKPSRRIR